ncbi:ferric-chelate reductase Frp1 [Exophiala dermatitidis]|uniref:ferric-chelate reductase (NADPH) n=2 Tax=Exophiala dermatitidis TaxID=5970 RepID=H6C196_EXODN|nr:metalloreductase transmembrane component [Exophiala dermatitidis NIH/UT8656]KAJ4520705.1 ferric-chelate reductase Frp1 [Exophiala dermatitidis]EHY57379.1 metalloreductase transmembrane component [Exophiala dermatitidis NIH/UT8656]KAJ4521847.1 ferric-chelate reductase Frp1 [Exophiala dermatitidis]KAJ4537649.1 ferric-chelate reductase Frp1 [Exophiala dermatitidis]KAJ4551685.1 ferric-chelate reductase Frp1 [Exophiala dermatitidis]
MAITHLSPRHDMGGMDMGSMGSGSGVPGYFYMQKMFWAVIGTAIGVAALCNLLNHILLWQRQRSLSAKPKSFLWSSYATLTAVAREISSASLPAYQLKWLKFRAPSLGKTIMVLSYLITVIVFCFYKYDTEDQWSWENIAYRCGCIAQAQLPLVFLLAGKQNIVGFLSGISYERLNWLHRWVARILWLTATFHLMFWFRSWARYDYIKVKLTTDSMTQTGFAAWCILTALVATSFAPMRRVNYEVFVVAHLVLFAGFIGAVMLHVDYGKTYVWVCVALFFFDRVARFLVTLVANLSIFHRRVPGRSLFWANKAVLTPLPGNVTRITIDKPVLRWSPGQHVFLSCHTVVPLQSHPFSIASLESDGKLEFLVQAQKGGTKRLHRYALRNLGLPRSEDVADVKYKLVGVEGPYGKIRPLRQFDSICFFAGGTGATFTVPLMRDIVRRWKSSVDGASGIVTRKIRFVWVVKSQDRVGWFKEQLQTALLDVGNVQRCDGFSKKELDLSIYVTCDETLDASNGDACCEPPAHGTVKVADTTSSDAEALTKKVADEKVEVRSIASTDRNNDGCGPDGTCCCKNAVDEDGEAIRCCCCGPSSSSIPSSSSVSSISEKSPKALKAMSAAAVPQLKLIGGRPKPRDIIRKVLEEAEGESAVVVCGPQGLQDDVRRSVVALSDERAVHKGTGAQGIYLHVEGFSY